jgi:hypothetical protein
MNKLAIGIVVVVLILAFFLLPIASYDSSDSGFLGVSNTAFHASVSISFDLFHCGYVLNPISTSSVFGYKVGQAVGLTGFYCEIAPNSG